MGIAWIRAGRVVAPIGVGLLAVSMAVPAGAAPAPSSAAASGAMGTQAPMASTSTSLRNPEVLFRFNLTALPTGTGKVRIDTSTRVRGKSRYVARLTVDRYGTGRIQYLAINSAGSTRSLSSAITVLRGLRAKRTYDLQTRTRTSGSRVLLSTRVWDHARTPTPTWLVRSDTRSNRLLGSGTSRVTGTRSGSASPRIWAITVTNLDAPAPVTTSTQPPASPPPPPPPTVTTLQVGSAGAPYTGSAPTVPPAHLPGVLPDSSIAIPASPPADGSYIFVSPDAGVASDSNTGRDRAHPVRTVPKAADLVSANGFIVLMSGVYPAAANAVTLTKAGVTLTADTGASVTLDGSVALDPATGATSGSTLTYPYTQVPSAIGIGLDLNRLPAAVGGGRLTPLATERGWACVPGDGASYQAHGATSSTNVAGCPSGTTARVIANYLADEVWSRTSEGGLRRLVQVTDRSLVGPGRFYVARSSATDRDIRATTLYLDPSDGAAVRVATPGRVDRWRLQASQILVAAPGIRINGLRVFGYAGPWTSPVITSWGPNSNLTMKNVEIEDCSGPAVHVATPGTPGGADVVRNVTISRVRILGSGTPGIMLDWVTGARITDSELAGGNPAGDGTDTAMIHGIRLHDAVVSGNVVRDSNTYGMWFDMSSYAVTLVGNRVTGNSLSQVFYEVSHALTMIGNLLVGGSSDPTLRLGSASGTKLVSNTIVGGRDTIWAYSDPRSKKYVDAQTGSLRLCSEHAYRYGKATVADWQRDCHWADALDFARPGAYGGSGVQNLTPGLTWRLSMLMMVNNVLGAPAATGTVCNVRAVICVSSTELTSAGKPEVAMAEILPKSARIDGNVYETDATLMHLWPWYNQPGLLEAKDLLAVQAGLAGSYFGLVEPEWHGQHGLGWVSSDGTPTDRLTAIHGSAAPTPEDPVVNAYLPAGARHYGAFP